LLNETLYTQPALFAFEYALAELWRSWGITPDLLLGHSVGEYVAACVAGVLSLEDGLRLIAKRAELMQSLPRYGSMAAVFASVEQVTKAIAPYLDQVSIAAVNGPQHVVISGQSKAVEDIARTLEAEGIQSKPLTVSHAFHSPLMEPILDSFEQFARRITYAAPRLRLVSNLTGQPFAPGEAPDAGYWRRHLREAVQFSEGVATLQQHGCVTFLEIGPHPTLLAMARGNVPQEYGTWLASIRRKREGLGADPAESCHALRPRGKDRLVARRS
jgi:acyl transferase domain-containing protein